MKTLNRLSVTGIVALACLSSAQAGTSLHRHDAGKMEALRADVSVDKSSIYIVQMRDQPVIAYQGGLAGFKGTKPAQGGKIQKSDPSVQDYAAHLDAQHNRAIRSVDAKKVYNYRYGFNGFAARMSAADAAKLQKRGDVLNVWKNEFHKIQTDTSPKYIGVSQAGQAWARGMKGENVIIASIDTGIWPEHPSFADNQASGPGNLRPWQGHLNISTSYNRLPNFKSSGCDFGNTAANPDDVAASCSDKLITARCYNSAFSSEADPANPCGGDGAFTGDFEFQSARDYDGHGSHTAATAGGNNGVLASIDGTDLGLVSGIAPRARIAAYKVCWDGPDPSVTTDDGCGSADSAAAIDQAIADGVDVINFSIGGSSTSFTGADDIAFLFAADAGIFVATSNGNSGPTPQTTGTPAGVPWITAVGATQDNGVLGAGLKVVLPADIAATYLGMEGSGDVTYAQTGDISGRLVLGNPVNGCTELTNASDISGNIAFIQRGACAFTVKYNMAAAAGARAIVVFNNDGDPIVMSAPDTTIPGQMIAQSEGETIASFADDGPILANVGPSFATSMENRIAGFSSRGPNGGALNLIKPDISAPGTAILAAESPAQDGELFQSISGTSMASPHVAGAFALIKQANPGWTPAMARSALMTTGRQGLMKTFGSEPATPFDIGAGEILPTTALYPGLAYDAGFGDYLAFSCGNNVPLVSPATCSALISGGFPTDGSDLNIASIAVASLVNSKTISRTVTSVGLGYNWYNVTVDAPAGLDVTVSPDSIWLGQGDSATYEVTFTPNDDVTYNEWGFGSLTWANSSGLKVRSPIAINVALIVTRAEVDSVADADGAGTAEVPVQFGYTGDYSVDMSGLEAGTPFSDTLAEPGDSHLWCLDLPANVYTRIATYDAETSNPGEDDLDLSVYLGDSDCANSTSISFLASSGGVTSEETVDIPDAPAGAYFVFVDHFSAPAGGPIDYTLWYQPVFGDNGNTTVTAPAEAVGGEFANVTVDYAGLVQGRYLGRLQHNNADGEIASTIIGVDATGSAPAPEAPE